MIYNINIRYIADDKTMPGTKTITPHDQVDYSNHIDLSRFAPKLRKLGKYLLQNDNPTTIKAACDELELNYDSVNALVWKEKQKGNDFYQFIKDIAQSRLEMNRVAVYDAMIAGAVSSAPSSYQDRKTFLQVSGDLRESNVNVNVGSLTIGVNINSLPTDAGRDKGVIDVEPFIPGKK